MKIVRGPVSKVIFRVATQLLLVAVAVQLGLLLSSRSSLRARATPLDSAQIASLRQRYSVMVKQPSPMDDKPFTLQGYIKLVANVYVVAEVVEILPDHVESIPIYPDEKLPALAEKEKSLGFTLPRMFETTYASCRFRIIDIFYQGDSSFRLEPGLKISRGQVINASENISSELSVPLPDLQPGMQVVMGIMMTPESFANAWDYNFGCSGLYYLVDQKYVLSAYKEAEPAVFSGYELNQFKRAIQDIRETPGPLDEFIGKYPAGSE